MSVGICCLHTRCITNWQLSKYTTLQDPRGQQLTSCHGQLCLPIDEAWCSLVLSPQSVLVALDGCMAWSRGSSRSLEGVARYPDEVLSCQDLAAAESPIVWSWLKDLRRQLHPHTMHPHKQHARPTSNHHSTQHGTIGGALESCTLLLTGCAVLPKCWPIANVLLWSCAASQLHSLAVACPSKLTCWTDWRLAVACLQAVPVNSKRK